MTVVIPSKNIHNLVPCLGAIRAHEQPADVSVIVIDDGLQLEPRPPVLDGALILPGIKPFVYARNCNRGILAADPDDVILLNDDALLKTRGGFSALAQAAREHPEYGVIAAATSHVGNRNQWPHGAKGLRDEPRMVCFVCVYIRREVIEQVGLLDERYVGYGCDDDDYCFSARKAGLKIGVFDGCVVDHGSLKSTFRGGPVNHGDYRPNLKLFIQKWGTDNWGRPARA